jgi:hypothetical protein
MSPFDILVGRAASPENVLCMKKSYLLNKSVFHRDIGRPSHRFVDMAGMATHTRHKFAMFSRHTKVAPQNLVRDRVQPFDCQFTDDVRIRAVK